jgi:hypothetical protein
MAMILTLLRLGDTCRRIYLYDTFEGMTEPTGKDVDLLKVLTRDASRFGCHRPPYSNMIYKPTEIVWTILLRTSIH